MDIIYTFIFELPMTTIILTLCFIFIVALARDEWAKRRL